MDKPTVSSNGTATLDISGYVFNAKFELEEHEEDLNPFIVKMELEDEKDIEFQCVPNDIETDTKELLYDESIDGAPAKDPLSSDIKEESEAKHLIKSEIKVKELLDYENDLKTNEIKLEEVKEEIEMPKNDNARKSGRKIKKKIFEDCIQGKEVNKLLENTTKLLSKRGNNRLPCKNGDNAKLPCKNSNDAKLPCKIGNDTKLPCKSGEDAKLPCESSNNMETALAPCVVSTNNTRLLCNCPELFCNQKTKSGAVQGIEEEIEPPKNEIARKSGRKIKKKIFEGCIQGKEVNSVLVNNMRLLCNSGNNTRPPCNSGNNTRPPYNSGNDTRPLCNNMRPACNSGNNTRPPYNSGNNTRSPCKNTRPPCHSGNNMRPPSNSGNNMRPPCNSGNNTRPPCNSGNNTRPPCNSDNNTRPPCNSGNNTSSPCNSDNTRSPCNSGNNMRPPNNSGNNTRSSCNSNNTRSSCTCSELYCNQKMKSSVFQEDKVKHRKNCTFANLNTPRSISDSSLKRRYVLHYCKKCNFKCFDSSSLLRHIKTHFRISRYQCDICGSQITYSQSLLAHIRCKRKLKPFCCTQCGFGVPGSTPIQST